MRMLRLNKNYPNNGPVCDEDYMGKEFGFGFFLETRHFLKRNREKKIFALNKKSAGKCWLHYPRLLWRSSCLLLVPSPGASSPPSHLSVPFSVYLPFHFLWVF